MNGDVIVQKCVKQGKMVIVITSHILPTSLCTHKVGHYYYTDIILTCFFITNLHVEIEVDHQNCVHCPLHTLASKNVYIDIDNNKYFSC